MDEEKQNKDSIFLAQLKEMTAWHWRQSRNEKVERKIIINCVHEVGPVNCNILLLKTLTTIQRIKLFKLANDWPMSLGNIQFLPFTDSHWNRYFLGVNVKLDD